MRCVAAGMSALSLALLPACAGAWPAPDEVPAERACAGLPAAVMDDAIAGLRANVESVEPLIESSNPKAPPHRAGAVVHVRATPGMTAQWLGRVLACSAVRQVTETERWPPAFAGALREVTPTPTGFAITLRAREPDLAGEIERQARALVATGAR
jgi:hypothetical protein